MAETVSPPRPEAGKKPGTDEDRVRIVLTGLDKSAEAFGREAAHEKRSKNPEGPAWKRVVKSAWNNLSHEYQLVKDTHEKTEEVFENGLLYHYGLDDTEWREATQERYASDYAEEMLRDGETFHKLHELDTENANRIQEDVIALVANRAKGIIPDEASFNAALERMAKDWHDSGISQEFIGEGRMLGHNMDKMAMQVKAMVDAIAGLSDVEKQTKIDEYLANADVIVGEAKVGPEVEIEETTAERIANKMKKVPFLNEGRFAKVASFVTNETVVAGVISVGTYGASRLASMAATGIGGGVTAAMRERRALKAERALAERRRFMGAEQTEMPDNSADSKARRIMKMAGVGISEEQRRAEIEETLLNTVPADEVIADIGRFYSDEGDLLITNADQLQEALAVFGHAKAHADRKLLGVEDVEVAEKASRLFEAQVAIAKLKTDIAKLYSDDIARSVLDIEEDQLGDHLDEAVGLQERLINQESLEADKLMRKLMRKRILQRGLMGAGVGFVVGEAVHAAENLAFGGAGAAAGAATAHAPENVNGGGHAPGSVDGGSHAPGSVNGGESHAPGSVNGGGGSHAPGEVNGSGTHAPENVGSSESDIHAPGSVDGATHAPEEVNGSGSAHAPESVNGGTSHAPENVDGGESHAPGSVNGGESHAPGEVNGGGSGEGVTEELSDHSKVTMPDGYKTEIADGHMTLTTPDGKTISNLEVNKDGSLTAQAQDTLRQSGLKISDHVNIVQGSPEVSHVSVSPNEFVANHKEDMTTIGHREWVKGPDELRLINHVNADGSVTIDISGMENSAWQTAAANGHMNVYLGASTGSSGHGIKIPIGPDGKATIAADSPARALIDAQGQPSGYEEAAITGDNVNGADHIAVLATAEGNNKDSLVDSVTSREPYATHSYTITESGTNINADNSLFVTDIGEADASGAIYPITSRKGMGQPTRRVTPSTASSTTSTGPTTGGPDSSGGPEASAADTDTDTDAETDTDSTSTGPEAGTDEGDEAKTGTDTGDDTSESTEEEGTGGPEADEGDAESESTEENADTSSDTGEDEGETAPGSDEDEGEERSGGDTDEDNDTGPEASTGPEAEAEEEKEEETETPETPKTSAEKEKEFFEELDKEKLDTEYGFDFPGYLDLGERGRKQAMRYITQAIKEMGDADKVAVVDRATQLANENLATGGAEMQTLLTDTLNVLGKSRERGTKDVADNAPGAALLDGLEEEDVTKFPFAGAFKKAGLRKQDYAADGLRLASRVYDEVMNEIRAAAREEFQRQAAIDGLDPDSDEYKDKYAKAGAWPIAPNKTAPSAEKKAYNAYVRKFMSKAQKLLNKSEKSIGSKPTPGQRAIYDKQKEAIDVAKRVVNQVRSIYEVR